MVSQIKLNIFLIKIIINILRWLKTKKEEVVIKRWREKMLLQRGVIRVEN